MTHSRSIAALWHGLRALLLGALLLGQTAFAADQLRVGFMPIVPFSASLLAKQHGWIEEELRRIGRDEVRVQWFQFAGGPPVNEAFAANAIDVAALGDTPALAGFASGIETRLIGLAYQGGQAQALLVRTGSPYQAVQDLKGRKVATLRGGNVHELLVLILAEAGLTMSDVAFINLGQQDLATALLKGDVEAILAWDPIYTQLASEGLVRVLRDGQGLKSNINPIVATAAMVQDDPVLLSAYLRAIARGAQALRDNPETAARTLAATFGLTPEQTLQAFSRSVFAPAVTDEVRAEIQRSIDFLLENRLIRRRFEPDQFIDVRMVARP